MERHDSPHTLDAVANALRWHETNGSQFDNEAARKFLDMLQEAGLAVAERGRTILEWSPWAVKEVRPGRVHVGPGGSRDHKIDAEATATLVRFPPLGRGPVVEREITVSTVFYADQGSVEDATRTALAQAVRNAREAADGFIAAIAEGEHEAA